MNLFAKEKELIFKIVNGILLIWFVAAIVVTAANVINLIIGDPNMVNQYGTAYTGVDVYTLRGLLGSIANVIIVGVALYIINKAPAKKVDTPKVEEEKKD